MSEITSKKNASKMNVSKQLTSKEKFLEFYSASKKRLEEKIEAFNESVSPDENVLLRKFTEYFADLNEGGKLLRGVFVGLGYRLAGNDDLSEADALAVAFEIFQTAVLIHDDIIDHADLRRGKPTVHNRYRRSLEDRNIISPTSDTPESAAICTGDLGLFFANKMIADEYSSSPILGKLIGYFNDIVIRTIRGELLDVILPCEIKSRELSEEESLELLRKSVMEIYHLKTACYSVIGPVHLGMLLGGMDPCRMKLIDEFADALGIAFQIKDDILGIFSSSEELGKSISSDIEEAKLTVLYRYVRETDSDACEELMKHYGADNVSDEDIICVRRIFEETGALKYSEMLMNEYFMKALEVLERCDFLREEDRILLEGIGEYFMSRTK